MLTALIDFATCALSVASSVGFKVILHVVLPLLIEVPSFGVGASSLASFCGTPCALALAVASQRLMMSSWRKICVKEWGVRWEVRVAEVSRALSWLRSCSHLIVIPQ